MKFDHVDRELIAALQNNARVSNKELAAQIGIAPSTCLVRVRRLTEHGVVRGYHAEVDPHSVGVGLQAIVAIQLQRHSRQVLEEFRTDVLTLPEVVCVYHIAGANDYLVHVAARDADHLRELTMTSFTTRPEVARMQTTLIFEQVDTHRLPILV